MKVFYDDTGRIRSWASDGAAPEGLHEAEIDDGIDPLGKGIVGGVLVDMPPEPIGLAREMRARRDALLSASDWTQLGDATADKAAWAAYRQELRDLTEQPGFPGEITWPARPVWTV